MCAVVKVKRTESIEPLHDPRRGGRIDAPLRGLEPGALGPHAHEAYPEHRGRQAEDDPAENEGPMERNEEPDDCGRGFGRGENDHHGRRDLEDDEDANERPECGASFHVTPANLCSAPLYQPAPSAAFRPSEPGDDRGVAAKLGMIDSSAARSARSPTALPADETPYPLGGAPVGARSDSRSHPARRVPLSRRRGYLDRCHAPYCEEQRRGHH